MIYSIVISMPIIPIIQITKSKCEYLVPFWQIIFTSQQLLFDDYLWLFDMIIWWLFDDYLMIIWWLVALSALFDTQRHFIHTKNGQSKRLTPFRFFQAMLPQNSCCQVCSTGKGYLWFAWLLTARSPLCVSMSTVSIVRTQGWEIAIAVNAFVIQKSLCRLALSLTYLAAHPQPQ